MAAGSVRLGDDLEVGLDVDRVPDRPVDGAAGHVVGERPSHGLEIRVRLDDEPVANPNALDHEDAVLDLDLTLGFRCEKPLARADAARFQRAPEGPGQSPGGSGDHVIERRRLLGLATARHAVVIRHLVVHAEEVRLGSTGEKCAPQWAANAFDANAGDVLGLCHGTIVLPSVR